MRLPRIQTCALTLLALLCFAGVVKAQRQKEVRPNVIVVITDDQGYGDFSCHGNPVLQTPALDRLYSEGVRFTDFHVAPLCTPTRGQLMTGMHALNNKAATVGTGRDMIRTDLTLMPEVFKRNGYRTGIFGKWHLGDNHPHRPMDRGFMKSVWTKGWGLLSEAEFDNDYYRTRYLDSLEVKQTDRYCTDLWFDEAMEWMGESAARGEPFFTYLATNTPHGPFLAPEADLAHFRAKGLDEKTSQFLGMVRNIDRNMERLEHFLAAKGILDNTVLLFLTDNGGTGGVDVFNAGMRGMKGQYYEGGHRGAWLMRWPSGPLPKGYSVKEPCEVQDVLPTLVDMLRLKSTSMQAFDGRSAIPLIKGHANEISERMLVVQYGGNHRPVKHAACVIWKAWRLVGRDELYDLASDPGQTENLAQRNPEVRRRMLDFYERWWEGKEASNERFVPIVAGTDFEDTLILTSNFWADSAYVNTQWKVANAVGPKDGGVWHIDVMRGGRYRMELSRWPFHLSRDLTTAGPSLSVGGSPLREGRALKIEIGCVSIDGGQPKQSRKERPDSDRIVMEMDLKAGPATLRAWFKDDQGRDLCGAYYLRLTRIGGANP
jgi:arylsulfatase A-like enzyme